MRNLNKYIKENSNEIEEGTYIDAVDEETGEIVRIFKKKLKEYKTSTPASAKELAQLKKLTDIEKELCDKADEVFDKIHHVEMEMVNVNHLIKSAQIDMEEDFAQASDETEKDKVSQKYGEMLNELETKFNSLKNERVKLSEEYNTLADKSFDATKKRIEYSEKISKKG